jgi:hypothetical protein
VPTLSSRATFKTPIPAARRTLMAVSIFGDTFGRPTSRRVPVPLQAPALPRRCPGVAPAADHAPLEQAILDVPSPTTRVGIRDRAMLHLCFSCGLRVSERWASR